MQWQGAGIQIFPAISRIDLEQWLFLRIGRARPRAKQNEEEQQGFHRYHSSFCRLARLIRSMMLVILSFFINRVL